ncbi:MULTISPECIES: acyltransferase [Arthrobacter]|uniref:Acyltransferase n=2 Tax=Arthrobacter TaxID=1663 RepID=A0ABU9KLE8_9MICC|nr:acyltransferase [Arthrobacter sp. YJM1]MDP5227720.1 acyltransferase [Arthrobacter sp. YJM1]
MNTRGRGRYLELDGLRGIAALAVVVGHFTYTYDTVYPGDPSSNLQFTWGNFGVELFFMISGYVILMTADNVSRAADFAVSRVSRLYPTYWIALAVSVVVAWFVKIPGVPLDPVTILVNLSMVQRWFLVKDVNDAFWTLAVEMQFYVLVFLLLVFMKSRLRDKAVTLVLSIWLVVATLVTGWIVLRHGIGVGNGLPRLDKLILNGTLAEYGPLFCVGILAYRFRQGRGRFWLVPAAQVLAVATGAAVWGWRYGLGVLAVCIAFSVVVAFRSVPLLRWHPIQFFGKISYSLYVIHVVVGYALIHLFVQGIGRVPAESVALIVVVAAAVILNRVGEVRLSGALKSVLKRKLAPSGKHSVHTRP